MKIYKSLDINGTVVDKSQLKKHLEKVALEHGITQKSRKDTYPIHDLIENFEIIKQVYNVLNEHLKLGISIHPAGEWLLDNFYVIEEIIKQIQKELTLKKYVNFVGISNGEYEGYARIYVIASEIVAYTDCKIDKDNLEEYLESYQTKKTLNMDEIWNIGIFIQIAIINKIKYVCEKIYSSQIQKYKAENIVERLIENKNRNELVFKNSTMLEKIFFKDMRYPFIEYMSYILKRYGKKGYSYLKVLEEEVEKTGTTVSDVIKKEHFDIAIKKVLMANSITSIKTIQRINFLEVFEKLNGVEEVLKQDPAGIYNNMDHNTKDYYRRTIKEISASTKISEIYIAKKILEIANSEKENIKKMHIGYYLIDKGMAQLYEQLQHKKCNTISEDTKTKIYISWIAFTTIIIAFLILYCIHVNINNIMVFVVGLLVLLIPSSEISIQLTQYVLSKIVKPKLIPKMDFLNGINEENATIVVIPTILKSKEKVQELTKKLELFYLANKSENLYFALLGDCSESDKEIEEFDKEVIQIGKNNVQILNEKYALNKIPKFYFIYRNRIWNESENKFLGWERKRGLLNQFNSYILGKSKNQFRVNTFENLEELPKIKYVITLDADTDLVLDSAFELVGAMSHILNTPVLNENKTVVIDGYGIMQPRIGVNLDISYKNLFTKIFAGSGGTDSYTNAISDIYQDNFKEGIFTGKGIYNLEVFSKVMENTIQENTVLSHDLLEGNYLRCGLVSDIMLMDGYPSKYNSFINRLSRWIRGDWQISKWIFSKKGNTLNLLSKYKIFDNLRRSLLEISVIIGLIFFGLINYNICLTILVIISIPYLLEILDQIILKKEGEKNQKTFAPKITGVKGALIRLIIAISVLPHKAYISIKAIIKTLYRILISKKHLLEWTTSEEAEKQSKVDVISYYKEMFINVLAGVITIFVSYNCQNLICCILGILWLIAPYIMCKISTDKKSKNAKDMLNNNEQKHIIEIGKRTWEYFETFLNKENNYLIPDNYQEDRKEKIVFRTSSTNIGLSLLAVISAYDLKYIKLDACIDLLEKIILSVDSLPKWNGHLYNWYNTNTKIELRPRYISTVDSGNFTGYLFVVKNFLENIRKENKNVNYLVQIVEKIINNTDFKYLYDKENRIFSIGFNIEENKLTDSYYDLLASEARQASIVAIAKKDIPAKHWSSLSRTITMMNGYSGLVSWSGTAFEYLMPNINIPKYEGSLLDESCKFMIMSQQEYAKKLKIPWGISEAAFNLKDLQSNYQYKAFGIPWLGLKRGLADELVVAPYGSILAITEEPKNVYKNLKVLEQFGAYSKFGFFESIDFTPERVENGKTASIVKTYMAHHQGLILLSINNLINNNIIQKRFMENPEIGAISILLQERIPEKAIITKEQKEKVEKLKYKDYENYIQNIYNKIDNKIIRGNIISNDEYTVAINQKGMGVSKYKNIYINRFKNTDDYPQGIFFNIKNIKDKSIWTSEYIKENNKYKINFMPDKVETNMINGNIKTTISTIIVPNEPVEIRKLNLENIGNTEEILEITSYFEPVLSKKEQDYAHPAFNNLFLVSEYNEEEKCLVIKRKNRDNNLQNIYLSVGLFTNAQTIGELEYEIDKEKFMGRGNWNIPDMVKNSIPFSKKIGLVTEPIVALKRIVKIGPEEKINLNLVLSVNEKEHISLNNLKNYKNDENIVKAFELSKAKVEAESRYLGIKGTDIELYQKMLSYIIFDNPIKNLNRKNLNNKNYKQSDLWKYGISGDLPLILVKIKDANDSYVIEEILKAYEFFRTKNVNAELVILDEEKYSYENYVRDEIETTILNHHMGYLNNANGGIFIINKNEIDKEDVKLIEFVANIIIDSNKGGIKNCLKEMEDKYLEQYKQIGDEQQSREIYTDETPDTDIISSQKNIKYYNEYGGFSEDGKEYLIKVNKDKKLPTVWSHVMANEKFGTIITENMGGYNWYKNSRLNRVTSWENHANYDIPSEVIYLKDEENKKMWSLGLNPMPDNKNYNVKYGLGYAQYIHKSNGLEQDVRVFVPRNDSIKIEIIKLKNTTPNKKKLKLIYYIKPVIGEEETKTDGYINLKFDKNNNIIYAQNLYNNDFENEIIYVSSSEEIKSYTGDKNFFLGNGGLSNPSGLGKITLNNENSIGKKPCIAYAVEVEIESFSEKEISFVLGAEDNLIDSKNIAYKYNKISNCKQEFNLTKNYWQELLGRVQINTPIESMNILINGWIPYQTIESRLIGRSGFYQSGGAFGFRDQLQDAIGLKYIDSNILKNQIIKHSKHQFIEGDVEHWWHEETKRGIRTRFSDDLLWLPFSVEKYIEFTGDNSILEEETSYIKGEILQDDKDEKYDLYKESNVKESIYNHCIRAIDKSLNFGEHGLPKIGSGDWNDALSRVGNKGKGESIWLGFFLFEILQKFIPICIEKNDSNLAKKYTKIKSELQRALNTEGWDGRWYKRAYMDNGHILGSMQNDECRIDSIAQSWSVISNAGDNDKKYISMESLENHLIDRENGIIKLLDPPFEKSEIDPGYIKSYLPGVRENGGQYTHGAIWTIIAFAMLGQGDKAFELYKMINPIEHSRTKQQSDKYKVEPYVIAADIYGAGNLAGRGGWTWYTGSSSWYYNTGIEYILGLKINKRKFKNRTLYSKGLERI